MSQLRAIVISAMICTRAAMQGRHNMLLRRMYPPSQVQAIARERADRPSIG
jgi:hypothetical protein